MWLLFDLNSFRTFKALGVKKETELCKRENSRLSRQTLWAGGARLTCTRLSPFLTLAAVPRTLTTIAQVSHIPQLSLSLSLYASVQEGGISTTLWRRIAAFCETFFFFFSCQFWLLVFCVVDMLRPARSTSSFEVGLWRFSFLCAFSRALKRRKKIGAAPAAVVDAFLKQLEIIPTPGKTTCWEFGKRRKEEKL